LPVSDGGHLARRAPNRDKLELVGRGPIPAGEWLEASLPIRATASLLIIATDLLHVLRRTAAVPPSNPSPCECENGRWGGRKR